MSKATENTTMLVGEFSKATVFFKKHFFFNSSIDPLNFEIDLSKLASLRLPIDGVNNDGEYQQYFENMRKKPELNESDIRIFKALADLDYIKNLKNIGGFEELKEKLGELGIDADSLKTSHYDITHKGHKYRFVNPENLSKKSIETLRKTPNTYIFLGDLSNVLLNISSEGVSSRYCPELSN